MMRTCDICGGLAGMPFNPPECRVYTSRDLGVTVFPLGCLSMRRVRVSVDATPEGAACTEGETGAIMQNGEPQGPPSRIADGVASAGLDLTTSGDRNRDG